MRVIALAMLTVYTAPDCLDCAAVKNLLRQADIPFREVDVTEIPDSREALAMLSGFRSVPQVFLGARFIGQVAEVRYLLQTGRMAELLQRPTE